MTYIINVRRAVTILIVACSMAVPASASAGELPATYSSDAAQSGSPPSTDRSDAAQSSWNAIQRSTFPVGEFRGGDSPADHPGMSRAPQYDGPTTIEVVRPERTIVRDVDEALPLILSSTALLLVLASAGIVLVRTRIVPRFGRSS